MKASWGMSFACIGIHISSLSHVILLHQTANLFLVPYQMVLLQLECWTGESQGLLMVLVGTLNFWLCSVICCKYHQP
ncbi:hypothetical protein QYF36_026383 [Acer negundo]|nr:hypothetical protein QYF36_026383 [Acer negundo]